MPPAAPPKPDRKPDAGAAPASATGASATGAPAEAGASAAEAESERTRQEPLPPLDLLAKLTNTPPPPETKLRSVVRRFKIWTPLAVLLVIIFAVVQAVRPLPDPTLVLGDAKTSFTFAGDKLSIPWPAQGQAAVKVVGSGEVGTFGDQKPVPTASVAKIMTAYVILKGHPLKKDEKGPQIDVDAKAVAEGNSESESRIAGLKAGQKFSEQDMLKMLMIPSGNNIARLLARWDTQSDNEAAFVKKMNAAAKDLGMTNTTYTDPSGLDAKTVSTAVDQIKLAEAVMKFDAFRPIVAMPNAAIPGLPERINNNNDNLLLAGLSIKGIKTGSSTAAGGTLSWAAYKTVDGKDRLILGTMMDQHFKGLDPNASNSLTMVKDNSKKVIEAVRTALTSATAVKKGQVVGYVDDGLDGLTPVVATKDLSAVGVPGQKLELSIGSDGKAVPHEAKAGTVVGELAVGNGASQQRVPVALQSDLAKPSFGAKLTRLG
nr:D-alanyl-D-alanine carboxypeptidase [Streptomyces sp. SID8354]